MFSVILRNPCSLKYPAIKLTKQVNKFSIYPSLYYLNIRDIQQPSHGESGSLTTRFIKYIALENCKFDPLIKTKIKYSQLYPMHNIRDFKNTLSSIDIDQLPKLIIYTYTFKTNGEPTKVSQVINEIDNICCNNLSRMSNSDILRILYSFMYLIPNKIVKLNFYSEAMQHLIENFTMKESKQEFVQICYYLGLWKKNKISSKLLKNFLDMFQNNYINELNQTDLAIVSNAMFKISLPCENREFEKLVTNETVDLASNCTDDSTLITFIKFLRLNRIKSSDVIESLKKLVENDSKKKSLHFKGLVHIFAYFADGLWNDENVYNNIVEECMSRIKAIKFESNLFNDMRSKDLATFFWCCANLGFQKLNENDFKFIENLLIAKVNNNEFKYYPDEYIDMVLSLWMLGFKSKKLIIPIEQEFMEVKFKKPHNERIKLNSRLELLLNCVRLEFPDWLEKKYTEKVFDEKRKCPEYLLKNRPNILKVMKYLNENLEELKINYVLIALPIQEINSPSIYLEYENGKKYFLEILDRVLKFNNQPIAIINLKIKLLEESGYKVIKVNEKDCDLISDELKNQLLELSEVKQINKAVV